MNFRKVALQTGTKLVEMGFNTQEQMAELIEERFKPPRQGLLNISCPQCNQRFKRQFGENLGMEFLEYVDHWLDHVKEERDDSERQAASGDPGQP